MIIDNPRDSSSYLGLLSNGLVILSMLTIMSDKKHEE